MLISKTDSVINKVFCKKDIEKITALFIKMYVNSLTTAEYDFHVSLDVKILVDDQTSYSFENEEVTVDLNDLLDNKKCTSISFYFHETTNNKKRNTLSVMLSESRVSEIDYQSDDQDWYNKVKSYLEEIITDTKNQENFFTRYKNIISMILSICTGIFAVSIFYIFMNMLFGQSENSNNEASDYSLSMTITLYTMLVISTFSIGYIFSRPIISYLSSLWPTIEFDFGPEHLKRSKNRRSTIWVILIVLIIPIILMLIPIFL